MGLGRYVVNAIVLEGRSPSELAREPGISRSWIYELVGRYRQGGYAALEPRSRRPRSCAHRTPPRVEGVTSDAPELTSHSIEGGRDLLTAHSQCRAALGYQTVFFLRDMSRTIRTSVANLRRRWA